MKKAKPKIPVNWEEPELEFIRNNYFEMTWSELVTAVNTIKPGITMHALRYQCIRMKLKKQIQIRWSKDDIQFLIDNYKIIGNIEMAEILTEKGRTFRIIDGVKVVCKFKPKNIEKKMNFLGLKRTEEDLKYIIEHNRKIGKGYCWTKENNAYTMGIKTVYDNGIIREWSLNNRLIKHIKIDGKFIPLHRYLWEQENGDIPKGFNVVFKDNNPDNCVLDNLECISNDELIKRNSASLNLSDGFVSFCIAGKRNEKELRGELKKHPQLLDLKRKQLFINRQIKKQKNGSNEKR